MLHRNTIPGVCQDEKFGLLQLLISLVLGLYIFLSDFWITRRIYGGEAGEYLLEYFLFSILFLASGMLLLFSIVVLVFFVLWERYVSSTVAVVFLFALVFTALFFLRKSFGEIDDFILYGFFLFSISATLIVNYMKRKTPNLMLFLYLWLSGITMLSICQSVFLIVSILVSEFFVPWEAQKSQAFLLLFFWFVFPIAVYRGVRRGLDKRRPSSTADQ